MNNLKVTDLRATKRDSLLRIQAEITNISSGNQQALLSLQVAG